MESLQKSVIFTNATGQLIQTRLTAQTLKSSYSKHESAMTNANKIANAQYHNLSNSQLHSDASTSLQDDSRKIDGHIGGGLSSAMSVAANIGSKWLGGGGSVSKNMSGNGLFNASYTNSNIKNETKDKTDIESDSKVSSNQHLTDQQQSNYLKKESQNKWNDVKVGFTMVCPNQTVEVTVEINKASQRIYMDIIQDNLVICSHSEVSQAEIIVEYNQRIHTFVAKPYFRDERFEKAMRSKGLGGYINVMQANGWDDTQNWVYLTDEILLNDLKFNKGHLYTFKRMVDEQFKIKLKQKDDKDETKNGYDV